MRITLDLSRDVVEAIRETADFHGISTGRAASRLIREGICPVNKRVRRTRDGIPLFPRRRKSPDDPIVTSALIKRLDAATEYKITKYFKKGTRQRSRSSANAVGSDSEA